ncbi:MAG: hypothetical protein KAQ74_07095 [Dehalococcoidia bacterium]|nr:hypothetical protein [Dehalococcoidia bacterium]
MTAPSERWIQIVVSAKQSEEDRKESISLPANASIVDLLEVLKSTSSPLYEDVRKRVLRLSGDVLAFGKERPALHSLRNQLASGGPVVIPDATLDSPSQEN